MACATIAVIGCATKPSETVEPTGEGKIERSNVLRALTLDQALEERILALDPEHISDYDVRSTLAVGPTSRIILLHASVYPVYLIMAITQYLTGSRIHGQMATDREPT